MAFSTSEILRLKYELGYNNLTTGAVPWIGITAVFEGVVNQNLPVEIATTSATTVVSASVPTGVTLVLSSAVGFAAGQRILVDVDSAIERPTIRSLSGANCRVLLSKAHDGEYPIAVEGPHSFVRDLLWKCQLVRDQMEQCQGTGAVKQVDEIGFYEGKKKDMFFKLQSQLMAYRDEISSIISVTNVWRHSSGCSTISVY